jgi:PPE-repeat protein
MWVQDATAMYTYAADSTVASTLTPHTEPPQTTNESEQLDQTRAAAQTTAKTTSARTQSVVQLAQSNATGTFTLGPGQSTVYNGVTITNLSTTSAFTYTIDGTLTGSGNIFIGDAADVLTVAQGGTLIVNSTINLGQGGILAIGSGGTLNTSGGGLAIVNGSLTVGSGATVALDGGQFGINGGAVTVLNSAVTLSGIPNLQLGAGATAIQSGTVTATTANLTAINAQIAAGNLSIVSTGSPVVPVVPAAAATPGAIPPGLSAPGLAGTAGIQPQLGVDGLMDLARSVSGVDLAADAALAAG